MTPRVVFMGEKPFGERCLRDLLSRDCEVIAVATRSESANTWWGQNDIYTIARENNIPVVPRSEIMHLKPDIIISILYPFIIEEEVLGSAKKAYNLHLAPLPEYRGCNCGSHALMDGRISFGVTLHEMVPELDKGRIVEKKYFPLTNTDTSKTLYDTAVEVGYAVWLNNIDAILQDSVTFEDVDEELYAESQLFGRNSLENKQIPRHLTKRQLYDFVRGLDFPPFDPAYFVTQEGERVELRTADFDAETATLLDTDLQNALTEYLQSYATEDSTNI